MDMQQTLDLLLELQRATASHLQNLAERHVRSDAHLQALTQQQAALVGIVAQQQSQIGALLNALGTLTESQRTLAESQVALTEAQRRTVEQLLTLSERTESLARTFEDWLRVNNFGRRPN